MKSLLCIASILILIALCGLSVVFAAGGSTITPYWSEHAELLLKTVMFLATVIGMLLTVVGVFIIRTLVSIERKLTKLYKWIEELAKDFYKLQGAHDARVASGGFCGFGPSSRPEARQEGPHP